MTTALDEFNARRAIDTKRTKDRKRRTSIPVDVLKAKIIGHPCRVCAATVGRQEYGAAEAHHLVPRGRLRGPDLHTDENLIPLCHTHHQQHHTTTDRVPRALLTPGEVDFLFDHETPGWIDTWYPDTGDTP